MLINSWDLCVITSTTNLYRLSYSDICHCKCVCKMRLFTLCESDFVVTGSITENEYTTAELRVWKEDYTKLHLPTQRYSGYSCTGTYNYTDYSFCSIVSFLITNIGYNIFFSCCSPLQWLLNFWEFKKIFDSRMHLQCILQYLNQEITTQKLSQIHRLMSGTNSSTE